jgi:hypothetical protein
MAKSGEGELVARRTTDRYVPPTANRSRFMKRIQRARPWRRAWRWIQIRPAANLSEGLSRINGTTHRSVEPTRRGAFTEAKRPMPKIARSATWPRAPVRVRAPTPKHRKPRSRRGRAPQLGNREAASLYGSRARPAVVTQPRTRAAAGEGPDPARRHFKRAEEFAPGSRSIR